MTDIYYIEDDENIACSVKEYLEQHNCKIITFSTVALAKSAMLQSLPDIVLLDWNMPDGQGSELCRWIRNHWEHLPVIFLTVRSDSHDIVAGLGYGADDYVVKPFELNVLYSRILALLRRTGQTNNSRLSCDDLLLDKEK